MARKVTHLTNKDKFKELEPHWATVRLGYLREIPMEVKKEIESIYKSEIDSTFFANYYCKGCFYNIIERLIRFYDL
jgi:hypothetical protein